MEISHIGNGKAFLIGYTHGLFRYFLRKRGLSCESKTPEVIFYSVYDPLDVINLRAIRKRNRKTLIIAGGIECFSPGYLVPYADFACAGEGFGFLRDFPSTSVEDLSTWAEKQKNIVGLGQIGKILEPDFYIPWSELPAVKVGKNVHYYLVSRGCRNKCAFCATSWLNPNVQHPAPNMAVLGGMAKQEGIHKKAVYLIGNDTGDFPTPYWSKAAASVSVKKFLANPEQFRKRMLLHIGIEGTTEKQRQLYGKPISSEEIRTLFHITKNFKINIVLFFIVQQPWDMSEFLAAIPYDTDAYPRVTLKFTQLSPTPWTPMENHDLSREEPFPVKYWFNYLSAKNRRFRTFNVLALEKEHTKVLLRRAMPDQTEKILELRKHWGDFGKWREVVMADSELGKMYRGEFKRAFGLKHPHEAWERAKAKVLVAEGGGCLENAT